MPLYSCHHSGDQYRISKFDDDMNVQSSYLCTETECDCPAGVRPICRHREMLPKFIQRQHVNDEWFFDYDRGGWVQMGEEWATPADLHYRDVARLELNDRLRPHRVAANPADFDSANGGSNPSVAAKPLPPAHYPSWRRI